MNAADSGYDDDFMATLLGEFLDESHNHLNSLNENLLALDEYLQSLDEGHSCGVDEERLNEMFRAAHSLKGLSAMLSLEDINRLTHRTENILDAARRRQLDVNQEVVDLILQAVDHLTAMIHCLKEGRAIDVDYQPTIDSIQHLLDSAGVSTKASRTLADELAIELGSKDSVRDAAAYYDQSMAQVAAREHHHQKGTTAVSDAVPSAQEMLQQFESVIDDTNIPEKYVAIFLDESNGCLEQMADVVGSEDANLHISQLMRLGHQMKGSAAAAGFHRVARVMHHLEDALTQVSSGSYGLSAALREAILVTIDAIRQSLDTYGQESGGDGLNAALAALLKATCEASLPIEPSSTPGPIVTPRPSPTLDTETKSAMTLESLDVEATSPVAANNKPAIRVEPTESASETENDGADRTASTNGSSGPATKGRPTETIRVDIDRLDQLMNLTGQLVINKARFGRLGNRLKTLTSVKQASHALASVTTLMERAVADVEREADHLTPDSLTLQLLDQLQQMKPLLEVVQREVARMSHARTLVSELAEAVHQLDRVADGIQKSVMDTRMLPIGPLFGRFKRVIRDVTRVNGKDVRLVVHGEKTELDKRMIDEIGDPLIHMIRNAADHGIETSEERVAAGKTPWGTITLNAFHRGNGILIQISDDGRGIDPVRIRAKALGNGLITEQDADRLSTNQLLQLIWEPGFSTAETITEVSGRGVGMDIVRSKIEQLNGTVELDSTLGTGTTFTIKLPLTMAILPSLLAKIQGDVFAIPVESVVDIVRVEEDELSTIHGVPTATVRGRAISVVDLAELFEWTVPPREQDIHAGERKTLVIVGADQRELGVVVAGLLGEEDIVIKSLSENYRSVDGIAGASILGDGRVALILDVNALLEMACKRSSRPCVLEPA